ncbi:VOC family protein [Asticcacaulis endophyticus]|uniref:Drug:proton antiporter n=1 Tax=Asticcacaulis endophyticus TaxID=1395890 RepID=A0A918Q050_9CAUL|nr:VOC family protein [Asticcacaulis endophyticus]GGZ28808.1 drug:proton antiporter [Asticcacaulis endophyticus]
MEPVKLQVCDVAISARFYAALLGCEAVGNSADHAVFVTEDMRLELVSGNPVTAHKIDIVMTDADRVVRTYEHLWDACVRLPQIPTDMGFGLGFVALDPDGHRLRVFCLYKAEAA